MQIKFTLIALCFWHTLIFAQSPIELFSESSESLDVELNSAIEDDYTILTLNEAAWNSILDEHPKKISLVIPFEGENFTLNFVESRPYKNDLLVRTASGESIDYNEASQSVFYHGVFEGYPNSHFSLSILNNEVIGVGATRELGNFNLGKLEGTDNYIFYAEKALQAVNPFSCHVTEQPERNDAPRDPRMVPVVDCISIYFEVDYDIFLAKGGVIESTDYIIAMFNEIQLMYEIDGMTVYLSDILVWDELSPYYEITDTGVLLDLFGTTTTDWEGNLGHLVTNSASGGLAWVGVFCAADQAIRKAVSGISLSFETIPTYSWTIDVVCHEMGHNVGSPHTHACFWNDDDTAIDGCGPAGGADEGCDADLPADGGTIMSYCHLVAEGKNLAFGFGEQPGEYMRTRILEGGCLEGCDLQVMDVQVDGGYLSPACENDPITTYLELTNNSNEHLTHFTAYLFIDGEYVKDFEWSGLILEEGSGTVALSSFSLPVGSYNMSIEIVYPDGYEDENSADNIFSVNFDVTPFPVASFYPESKQLVSLDATTTMFNETTGAASYEWNMGDGTTGITETSPEHTFPFNHGGNYNITLFATSAYGCVDTAYGDVNVEGVNIFYIPNSFTPDGNAFNDQFKPVFTANLDVYDYHFTIFNRYGEVIYESFNAAAGWDGTYGDREVITTGVYGWALEFGDLTSDQKHYHNGHVTVVR